MYSLDFSITLWVWVFCLFSEWMFPYQICLKVHIYIYIFIFFSLNVILLSYHVYLLEYFLFSVGMLSLNSCFTVSCWLTLVTHSEILYVYSSQLFLEQAKIPIFCYIEKTRIVILGEDPEPAL